MLCLAYKQFCCIDLAEGTCLNGSIGFKVGPVGDMYACCCSIVIKVVYATSSMQNHKFDSFLLQIVL